MLQTHHGEVPIPDLPASAKPVRIFPDHGYKPLLSLGKFADAGYSFHGDAHLMILSHPLHQKLIARRCPSSGMYLLSLTDPHTLPSPHQHVPSSLSNFKSCSARHAPVTSILANNAFAMSTKPDLAMYYHRAAFCPVPSTFIKAINNGAFASWPGLTAELISKHLPKSLATAKGHLKLARKNVRSTNSPPLPAPLQLTQQQADTPTLPASKTKTAFFKILEPKDLIASDLTGRFPVMSSKSMNYIMVCYVYDSNGILIRPMKNRSKAEHIRVYNDIFQNLEKRGLRPNVHRMDNECPKALRTIIVDDNKNTLKLVPLHDHRTNPAEKMIDTVKCHFISGLSILDPKFPLHL